MGKTNETEQRNHEQEQYEIDTLKNIIELLLRFSTADRERILRTVNVYFGRQEY
jgi:hypothetical protein